MSTRDDERAYSIGQSWQEDVRSVETLWQLAHDFLDVANAQKPAFLAGLAQHEAAAAPAPHVDHKPAEDNRAILDMTLSGLSRWEAEDDEHRAHIPDEKAGMALYESLATSDRWHETEPEGDTWAFVTVYPELDGGMVATRDGSTFALRPSEHIPDECLTWRGVPDMDLTKFDIIACSTSSGKDSMAMLYTIARLAEAQGVLDRVVALHAELGPRMDWPGCTELAEQQTGMLGIGLITCTRIGRVSTGRFREDQNAVPAYAKGEVIGDLLNDVEHRDYQLRTTATQWAGSTEITASGDTKGELAEAKAGAPPWFSPAIRFCTSDAKRAPLQRKMTELVHQWREDHGWKARGRGGRVCRVLDVQGLRAKESTGRSKLDQLELQQKTATREKWTWLPIQWWTEAEVWQCIEESGLPYHEVYDYGSKSGTSVEQRISAGMPRLSCRYCFAHETKVVTRQGIQEIGDLAGGTHDLLVPTVTPYGLSGDGPFQSVQVRSFGHQRIWNIKLRRGKQTLVLGATAEHRWLTLGRRIKRGANGRHLGYDTTTIEQTTQELKAGVVLRGLKAPTMVRTKMVPFAVARGFVFGDGSHNKADSRPGTLTIHTEPKATAMLPFFSMHDIERKQKEGKDADHIYGLPRRWKRLPSLDESRSYLLSWLAGYVAADGSVGETGSARLTSASQQNLLFAQGIFAICGVDYGPVSTSMRVGYGTEETPMSAFTFDALGLPPWFFRLAHHIKRVGERQEKDAKADNDKRWVVESVARTEREEEVFCAVVPGAQAFGLMHGIMTGNCCYAPAPALTLAAMFDDVGAIDSYIRIENETGFTFKPDHGMQEIKDAAAEGDVGDLDIKWNM